MATAKQRANGKKLARCNKRHRQTGISVKACMNGKGRKRTAKSNKLSLVARCEKVIARHSRKTSAAAIAADIARFQRNMPMDGIRRRRLFRVR